MREIKFRFYSNHLGKFVRPDDSIFAGAIIDPDMNPMQYTGLKDKNGVEIYEGDIVVKGHLPKDTIFTVEFDDGSFGAYGELDSEILGFSNNWEVIGNIYDSPELLK